MDRTPPTAEERLFVKSLHNNLDRLAAFYIKRTEKTLSETSVMDLLQWAHEFAEGALPAATPQWTVLYATEGVVHRIGPFASEKEADEAAKKAQAEGEFDIRDQDVYLLSPYHRMLEYSLRDLVGGTD